MRSRRPKLGSVVQISLPDGRYAYGRVLRDGAVAFYRRTSDEPGVPPIGDRDYQFVVGVSNDTLRSDDVPVVGFDPGVSEEDEWPPPQVVRDPIDGSVQRYERGVLRPATEAEVAGLEPVAAWALVHLLPRLVTGENPWFLTDPGDQ
ncbi:Imm26 family immunity protein [Agromyces sp. SYSU T00194]|uniref:Imm26 family immunity protein n=1 Tax=Agromyces chitinivorans TaxID=3158560 RepID=UPI00339627EF